jgi:CRP-like cAMP-binding protein
LVKLVKLLENGKERIVRIVFPGELFGLEGLTDSNYGLTSVTLSESEICVTSPDEFFSFLRRDSEVALNLVRFLVGDPDSEVTRQRERIEATPLTVSTRIAVTLEQLGRLRDADGIEARFSDRHIALSVFAFDDDMIVTPHLANLAGHESPALHLRRCQHDGIFDRFAMHVSALWDEARPVRYAAPSA